MYGPEFGHTVGLVITNYAKSMYSIANISHTPEIVSLFDIGEIIRASFYDVTPPLFFELLG